MQKYIALVFGIILAVLLLTACGDIGSISSAPGQASEAISGTDGAGTAAGTETAAETKAETETVTVIAAETSADSGVTAIRAEDKKIIDDIVAYFMPLTEIPRQSGHEEKVSEYLFNWAQERGFDPEKDEENNVFFEVPATKGMENAPLTILQGHMDMVIAVAEGKTFDPQKDGIKVINDGATLKGDGTSLGADDGMGIATALYIIEKKVAHGPLRVIFTTNEENGLTGAAALTEDSVAGAEYVINIDSENSQEVTNSSAASVLVQFTKEIETAAPTEKNAMEITIAGLQGGHSGQDIDKWRVNGIKAMGALLNFLQYSKIKFELASLEGGSANNAIPVKATAKIVYDPADETVIQEAIDYFREVLTLLYDGIETGFEIRTESCDVPDKVFSPAAKADLLRFVYKIHDGIYTMSLVVDGLVESSSNFGLISMDPEKSGTGTASTYIRSSDPEKLEALIKEQLALAENCKIEATASKRAEAWPVNPDSKLVKKIQSAYFQETGTDIAVVQIHAGLETGVFAKLDPKLDIVSVGPDIKNPHSVNETCYLATIPTVCRMLEKVLADIGTETAGASSEKEGDLVSTDYTQVAGTYTCSDDGSTVTLGKDGSVCVSIVRLAQLDGKADGIYKGIVKLNVTDPNGEPMKMEFIPETGELIAVESKWSYIKNGDSFKFDKKP